MKGFAADIEAGMPAIANRSGLFRGFANSLLRHNLKATVGRLRDQAMYTQPGRRFLRLDMLCDTLPRTDLILCRDGFVHLSFGDITRALRAMHDSGPEYLLVTTFIAHPRNREISTGGWRPLNLAIGPFYFPPPLCTLADCPPNGSFPDKALALYRFSVLSARLPELERIFRSGKLLPEALQRMPARLRQ